MIKNKVLQCLNLFWKRLEPGQDLADQLPSVVVVLKLFPIQRHPLNLGLAHFGWRFRDFN